VWQRPPADLEFATQAGFIRRMYDDDRTAFAVWLAGDDVISECASSCCPVSVHSVSPGF
jgi:hypothetical protein